MRKTIVACGILAASLSVGTGAYAFSDLKGHPAEAKIDKLHQSGVINGVTSDRFAPNAKVTNGQAIQFLVSGLGLKANDSDVPVFTKVNAKAWYASAIHIAAQNGLTLHASFDPNAVMTRADFAYLLKQALDAKGTYPVTRMYLYIADGDALSGELNSSLQVLLNTRIISLESGDRFRPHDAITRAEAAVWLYNAVEFARTSITPKTDLPAEPAGEADAYTSDVQVDKTSEGVSRVTLTVGGLPNPGYSVNVTKIEFGTGKTAVVYFRVTAPKTGFYTQVISKGTAVTYVPEGYTVTAKSEGGSSDSRYSDGSGSNPLR
ncbi:S-layer homology domain-containing protein [Paenibacillus spiritus]|nr:S-layer homology domain-containing protein [Paenibacillus spiritus]